MEDAEDAAALAVLAVYPMIDDAAREQLKTFAAAKGYKTARSGVVFEHFDAAPMASKHCCWLAMVEARKAAKAAFKSKNKHARDRRQIGGQVAGGRGAGGCGVGQAAGGRLDQGRGGQADEEGHHRVIFR